MKKAFDHDGLTLSYRDEGSGSALIFQHGLGANADQPFEVIEGLDGFRCITLDCRGHGGSAMGPVETLSIATFTDDLLALMDHLEIARAHVGGISMGAAITTQLAVKHPERVASLCVARPAWFDADAPENMAIFGVAAAFMKAGGRDAFSESAPFLALKAQSPDNAASLLGQFDAPDIAARSALLASIAKDGPGLCIADYGSIAQPTLVLGHGQDAVHPLSMARDVAAAVPHGALVEITPKSTDKSVYLVDFGSALSTFLNDQAG